MICIIVGAVINAYIVVDLLRLIVMSTLVDSKGGEQNIQVVNDNGMNSSVARGVNNTDVSLDDVQGGSKIRVELDAQELSGSVIHKNREDMLQDY